MTNAEARKLCELVLAREWRHGYATATNQEMRAIVTWCLTSLGQEDVMDAEVVKIQERHEAYESLLPWRNHESAAVHADRATLLKKLRAVTPAVTREQPSAEVIVDVAPFCKR